VRGGYVDTHTQRIVLQTEGQSVTPAQLARTVLVHHNGTNFTLGDVDRVQAAPAPQMGAASGSGKRGVSLIVDAAYGSSRV
jgi:Cu/Ag efflux pump CusA